MSNEIIRLTLILLSFVACYWALLAVDFERFLRKGKVLEAQVLCVLLAMGLSYLILQFVFSLRLFI